MKITIDEAIQHLKDSCYIVGYPTHDKQQETREKVNSSLDIAIDTMRKYQKIADLVYSWSAWNKDNYRLHRLREIIEEQEDGNN